MELRHLRYFVAVAEAGSLKWAAEKKLHTTQPSLSRQIRDLEDDVGAKLFLRGSRGVELTPAGRVFLDHARVLLAQSEVAVLSARQASVPAKPTLAVGFMIGHDTTWMPKVMNLLRDELPRLHVMVSTQNSPQLGNALCQGLIDAALMRREDGGPGLAYLPLEHERLEVYLPANHRFAKKSSIGIRELMGETFLSVSGSALAGSSRPPALRRTIDRFLKNRGIAIKPAHEVDNLGGIMSLIASTGGVSLLPTYAKSLLPPSVITRPLRGVAPRIDLSVGYRRSNKSPTLKLFLSRIGTIAVGFRSPSKRD